jgi:tRNA U55 pseudouridine synthase TruB
LRRTASGPFDVKDAVTLDELREWNKDKVLENFIPLQNVLTLI